MYLKLLVILFKLYVFRFDKRSKKKLDFETIMFSTQFQVSIFF